MRASRRIPLLIVIVGLAALIVSGCGGFFKPGSLQVSQPTGLGPVRVHFNTCNLGEDESDGVPCGPVETGETQPVELEHMIVLAIPAGATAPATVTEVGIGGGAPTIVLTRSDQVGAAFAAFRPEPEEMHAPWPPPAGSQIVGYISGVISESLVDRFEWSVDPEFTIPAGAPFPITVATGARAVEGEKYSADRPVNCGSESLAELEENATFCEIGEAKTTGTSELHIAAPAAASAFLGGTATLSFPLEGLTSASPVPTFALTATSSLTGATASPTQPTYVPTGVDPSTHRAAAASGGVTVTVPKTAAPGTYAVTLIATAPGGGVVSQTGSLVVAKPKLKFGKVKLNTAKGTATVTVTVPGAGTLTASGKGIVRAQKKASAPKALKLLIKAKGKTAKALAATGSAKLNAKFKFKPSSGIAVTQAKKLTLKLK
jgi:hypothetical protein